MMPGSIVPLPAADQAKNQIMPTIAVQKRINSSRLFLLSAASHCEQSGVFATAVLPHNLHWFLRRSRFWESNS
jgi:hypothetical protein